MSYMLEKKRVLGILSCSHNSELMLSRYTGDHISLIDFLMDDRDLDRSQKTFALLSGDLLDKGVVRKILLEIVERSLGVLGGDKPVFLWDAVNTAKVDAFAAGGDASENLSKAIRLAKDDASAVEKEMSVINKYKRELLVYPRFVYKLLCKQNLVEAASKCLWSNSHVAADQIVNACAVGCSYMAVYKRPGLFEDIRNAYCIAMESDNLDEYENLMEKYTFERYGVSNLRYDTEIKEHMYQFDDMCNVLGDCGLI